VGGAVEGSSAPAPLAWRRRAFRIPNAVVYTNRGARTDFAAVMYV
jgi:hypothetical protein